MTDLPDLPAIPCRQDITVLPADPSREPLGFKVWTYEGTSLLTPEGVAIPADQEIQVGQQVICWGCRATIDSPSTAKSSHTIWFLKRGDDDRNTWVCWGGANMRGLAKLQLSSDQPRGQVQDVIILDDSQEPLP